MTQIFKKPCTGITLLVFLLSFQTFTACKNVPRNNSHPEIANSDIEEGKELAAAHCQSCHTLPDPSLLNSKTWETGVLPVMGPRLGIFSYRHVNYPYIKDINFTKNFYPPKPLLDEDEWKKILNYYVAVAPDTLYNPKKFNVSIGNDLPLFSVKQPGHTNEAPASAMIKICSIQGESSVLLSDSRNHILYRYNKNLQKTDSFRTNGAIVDADFGKEQILLCDIGVLNPNNGKYGSGRIANFDVNNKFKRDSAPLLSGLERPVQISPADLNNDGNTDYLVCEFGFQTGSLSWMENKGNKEYVHHVIRPFPGAIKAYINDYNHDGLQDFWVLFAQGEEGIFLFTNKGNGQFDQKEVLRFPPVYGSSYFEFADFNKDGHPDIVYTCGDNADYSTILKPYHGVYIFMNDGKNNYSEKYFFHINGCYKAIARDFDNDGDLDIATISFFADYINRPKEGFVYLENKGILQFKPWSLPKTQQGRWLTMDAGDLNGDGKIDLILGNFSTGPNKIKPRYDWKKGPPFIVLQNTGKRQLP